MKAIILTFSKVENRGANLQCFALYNYLKQNNVEVEILDIQLPIKSNFIGKIQKNINNFLANNFRKEVELKFTKKYNTYDELKKDYPKADIYIVGSDQIWNTKITNTLDPRVYFLSFLPRHIKKVAYAASFGTNCWNKTIYDQEINDSLHSFTAISVREDEGVKICKDEFKLNNIYTVVDPTLLIDNDTLLRITNDKVNSNKQQYIFNYLLYKDDYTIKMVNKTKEILNLPIIGTPLKSSLKNITKNFYSIRRWLNNIKNAHFIITNSFHCMVFCILFKKNFITIPSEPGKSGRILSLLNKIHLTNRFISDIDQINISILKSPIDYDYVQTFLDSERNNAKSFINKYILDK